MCRARRRAQDRVAPGIVDGNAQVQRVAADSCVFRTGDGGRKTVGKPVAPTDDAETHAFLDEILRLVDEIGMEQRHQRVHFRLRPAPIVAREGVERQRADAVIGRGFHHAPHGLDAGFMA